MTKEETRALIARAQAGDDDARRRVTEDNLPLVRAMVKRFPGPPGETEDLFQIGVIGLIKAVDRFDLSFDVCFSTYAVPMISGEIRRYKRDNTAMRVPRSLKELQRRLLRACDELAQKNGREATTNELIEYVGGDKDETVLALAGLSPCASLDEPLADGLLTLADFLEDEPRTSPCDRVSLAECLKSLEERERTVIYLRFFKELTQARIADMLGLSQVQISRIESRAIKRLKKKMEA